MTTLPSFLIEGVKGLWQQNGSDNIDNLTAEDYDAFIKQHPEAKLKYLDEDEDEVIVGSSAELIDRISELGPGVPIVLQTVTPQGQEQWVSFMIDRATSKIKAPKEEQQPRSPQQEEERPRTPEEEIEHTLFENFQRDFERALKESLALNQYISSSSTSAAPSSNDESSQDTDSHPTVETFLRALTETLQSTLSAVYPHAANVTTQIRQHPALRQAAEVLQQVGHKAQEVRRTAHESIQSTDRKKLTEDVRKEVRDAMKNVGTALGEAFAEIGDAYAQVYKEINKEVLEIIQRTRGGSGANTPAREGQGETSDSEKEATEGAPEKAEEPKAETDTVPVSEKSEPKRNLSPTVEEETEQPKAEEKKEAKTEKLMEETPANDPAISELPGITANNFQSQSQTQSQSSSTANPFNISDSETSYDPFSLGTFGSAPPPIWNPPQSHSHPFGNRFGSFAGGGSSGFRGGRGRRGQLFGGPHGFSHHPPAWGRKRKDELQKEKEREQERFAREFEQGLRDELTAEEEKNELSSAEPQDEDKELPLENQDKVDECLAKLVDMGYDEVFDAERVRAVVVVAEGDLETAIALLTEGHD